MNKKLAVSLVAFSGVAAFFSIGMDGVMLYVSNIAVVSLCCVSFHKSNSNKEISTQ